MLEIHPERSRIELTDLNKDDRSRLRGIVGWILAASFIGALVIYATKAWAEEVPVHVFEDEAVSLQLFAAPCENEAAKLAIANSPIQDQADKLQRATSNWAVTTPMGIIRVDFAGCWVEFTWRGKEGYAVAFEDGELRFFPAEGFKRTKGQTGAGVVDTTISSGAGIV